MSLSAFACPICPSKFRKEYSKEEELARHINVVHLKWKPFHCPSCPRLFPALSDAQEHVSTKHNASTPQVYFFPDESKNEKLADLLRQNLNSPLNACPSCEGWVPTTSGKLTPSESLRTHLAGHLNYTPFQCGYCKVQLSVWCNLLRHLKKFHSKEKLKIIVEQDVDMEREIDEIIAKNASQNSEVENPDVIETFSSGSNSENEEETQGKSSKYESLPVIEENDKEWNQSLMSIDLTSNPEDPEIDEEVAAEPANSDIVALNGDTDQNVMKTIKPEADNQIPSLESEHQSSVFSSVKTETDENKEPATLMCSLCNTDIANDAEKKKYHAWTAHLGHPRAVACPHCLFSVEYDVAKVLNHIQTQHPDAEPKEITDSREEYEERLQDILEICFTTEDENEEVEAETNALEKQRSLKDGGVFCQLCAIHIGKSQMKIHIAKKHLGSVVLTCPKCDFKSSECRDLSVQKSLLTKHFEQTHHGSSETNDLFHDLDSKMQGFFMECFGKVLNSTGPSPNGEKLFCSLCDKIVTLTYNFPKRTHIWRCHMNGVKAFKCPECPVSSEFEKRYIAGHMKKKHPATSLDSIIDRRSEYADEVKQRMEECFEVSTEKKNRNVRTDFCKMCNKEVDISVGGQNQHVWTEHLGNPQALTCPHCPFTEGRNMDAMNEHIKSVHNKRDYTKIVDERPHFMEELADKLVECFRKEERTRVTCKLCEKKVLSTPIGLKRHVWCQHLEAKFGVFCAKCPYKTLFVINDARAHLHKVHQSKDPADIIDLRGDNVEKAERMLEICFPVEIKTGVSASERKNKSKKVRTEFCKMCNKEVDISVGGQNQHVWTEHLGNPQALTCPHCPFTEGRNMDAMNEHIKSVHNERDYTKIVDKRPQYLEDVADKVVDCFRKEDKTRANCKLCGKKVISTPIGLKRHVWCQHLGAKFGILCAKCPYKTLFVINDARAHLYKVHQSKDPADIIDLRGNNEEKAQKMLRKCFPYDESFRSKKQKKSGSGEIVRISRKRESPKELPTELCHLCNEKVEIRTLNSTKFHVLKAHMNNPQMLSCNLCDFTGSFLLSSMLKHLETTHRTKEHDFTDKRNEYQKELANVHRECFKKRKLGIIPTAFCGMCHEEVEITILRDHVWKIHMNNPQGVKCALCNFSEGIDLHSVKLHLTNAHKEENMSNLIDIRAEYEELLQSKMRECFKGEPEKETVQISCKICQVDIPKSSLRPHLWKIHLGNPFALFCSQCPYKGNYHIGNIKDHIKTKHKDNAHIIDKRNEYQEQIQATRNECFGPLIKMESKNMKVCKECNANVALNNMKNHVWTTHMNDPQALKCSDCDFTYGRDLRIIHQHLLNRHKISHLRNIVDTRRDYEEQLRNMMQTCFGSEKFKTRECRLCFADVAAICVKAHIWKKHMGDPQAIRCPICSHSTSFSRQHIINHMRSVHSDEDFEKIVDQRSDYEQTFRQKFRECFSLSKKQTRSNEHNLTMYSKFRKQIRNTKWVRARTFCKQCNKDVEIRHGGRQEHVFSDHLGNPDLFLCPHCPLNGGRCQRFVQFHIEKEHPGEATEAIIDRRSEFEAELNAQMFNCFGKAKKLPKRRSNNNEIGVTKKRARVELPATCKLCQIQVDRTEPYSLHRHCWTTHLGNPSALFCPNCDYETTYRMIDIRTHIKEAHGEDTVEDVIDKRSEYNEAWEKKILECFPSSTNIKRSTEDKKLCDECGETIPDNARSLRKHCWKRHMRNPQALKCGECKYTTGLEHRWLSEHYKNHHNRNIDDKAIDNRADYDEELSQSLYDCFKIEIKQRKIVNKHVKSCKLCAANVAVHALRDHVWQMHLDDSQAVQCPICSFSTARDLGSVRAHLARVHPGTDESTIIDKRTELEVLAKAIFPQCFTIDKEQPTKMCLQCGDYVASNENGMKKHVLRVHLGNPKLASCPHCDYSSNSDFDIRPLKLHISSKHPGQDPETFNDERACYSESLEKEMANCFREKSRIVSPKEGIACKLCKEIVREKSQYRHVWKVHLGNPNSSQCRVCGFTAKYDMKTMRDHMKRMHSRQENQYDELREKLKKPLKKMFNICFPLKSKNSASKPIPRRPNSSAIDLPKCKTEEADIQILEQPIKREHFSAETPVTKKRRTNKAEISNPMESPVTLPIPDLVRLEIRCQKCGKNVENRESEIRKHVWIDHMQDPSSITCNICGYGSRLSVLAMMKHMSSKHQIQSEKLANAKFTNRVSEYKKSYSKIKKMCFPVL